MKAGGLQRRNGIAISISDSVLTLSKAPHVTVKLRNSIQKSHLCGDDEWCI